jgi:(R,R)-butanediol dehydrogenase/meso-butanediol dehydrogenase/diacetyl reductase
VIDGTREDVIAAIRTAAGGLGPDVAFECAGILAVLTTALHAVKRTGTVVNVAIWGAPDPPQRPRLLGGLPDRDHRLPGRPPGDHRAAGRRPHRRRVLHHQADQARQADGGFHELIQNKDEHVKVLVQP